MSTTEDPLIQEIKQQLSPADLTSPNAKSKTACPHADCASHQKSKEECHILPDRWRCYICKRSGDIFTWLMVSQDLTFGEAKRELAARCGISLAPNRERTALLRQVLAAAHTYLFRTHPELLGYWEERGITRNVLFRYQVGYIDTEGEVLAASGVSREDLVALGLLHTTYRDGDRSALAGRYIFPVRDQRGRLVQLKGRLDPRADVPEDERDSKAKPLLAETTKGKARGFGRVSHMDYLFLEEDLAAARSNGQLDLAEGEPDALTFRRFEYDAAGLQTCQGLYKHAHKLRGIRHLYLWYDNDLASRQFIVQELFETQLRLPDAHLWLCTVPTLAGPDVKVDVNDAVAKHGWGRAELQATRDAAPDAVHVILDAWGPQVSNPATMTQLQQLLRTFRGERRAGYIERLSRITGIKSEFLAFMVDPRTQQTHDIA